MRWPESCSLVVIYSEGNSNVPPPAPGDGCQLSTSTTGGRREERASTSLPAKARIRGKRHRKTHHRVASLQNEAQRSGKQRTERGSDVTSAIVRSPRHLSEHSKISILLVYKPQMPRISDRSSKAYYTWTAPSSRSRRTNSPLRRC